MASTAAAADTKACVTAADTPASPHSTISPNQVLKYVEVKVIAAGKVVMTRGFSCTEDKLEAARNGVPRLVAALIREYGLGQVEHIVTVKDWLE